MEVFGVSQVTLLACVLIPIGLFLGFSSIIIRRIRQCI